MLIELCITSTFLHFSEINKSRIYFFLTYQSLNDPQYVSFATHTFPDYSVKKHNAEKLLGKFHCMETTRNVLNFHSNPTVSHPSTPERVDLNEFHSVEFMHLKVSSTLISHFFSTVGLNDFQFHINYTLIPQLVPCHCISNVELATSTVWY